MRDRKREHVRRDRHEAAAADQQHDVAEAAAAHSRRRLAARRWHAHRARVTSLDAARRRSTPLDAARRSPSATRERSMPTRVARETPRRRRANRIQSASLVVCRRDRWRWRLRRVANEGGHVRASQSVSPPSLCTVGSRECARPFARASTANRLSSSLCHEQPRPFYAVAERQNKQSPLRAELSCRRVCANAKVLEAS